jgi:hypothetical protein
VSKEEQRKQDLDLVSRMNGYGSIIRAQTHNIRGFNVNLNGTPAPKNKDHYGIAFFTRPDMNLSYNNIGVDRVLSTMLTNDKNSLARAIRVLLDPRGELEDRVSNLVDENQAFIPILTNSLISLSGWPDMTLDTYTSKEGAYKESYSMVDGTAHIYNTYELTATFQNIQGDPITLLFAIWLRYAAFVYDGTLAPYPDNLMQNTIDYQTRIYRFVMDSNFRYVQKVAACGAAFPIADPLGAAFNYSEEGEWNTSNDQISVPFRCIGATYLDPILFKEFNQIVQTHCIPMEDGNRASATRKIDPLLEYDGYGFIGVILLNTLTHLLYPRVDPYTLELEWYALKEDYDDAIEKLKALNIIGSEIVHS